MNLRKILAVAPIVAALFTAQVMAEEVSCRGCNDPLILSEDEWNCLLFMAKSLDANSSTVRFSLDQATCAALVKAPGKMKGGASADQTGMDQVPDGQAPETFKIDRDQLQCLKKRPDLVKKNGNSYVFDFTACPKAR